VEELRELSVRDRVLAFLAPTQRDAPPSSIPVAATIRRLGLDPGTGLRACLAHAEPDTLRVTVRTHPTSDLISGEVFLDLGAGGRWPLRHLVMRELFGDPEINPHFQPGREDVFTIDVAGQLRIGDITRAVIDIDEPSNDATWRPESVTLSVDGRAVKSIAFAAPPDVRRLDLRFPG
jgi:hypothetical protein